MKKHYPQITQIEMKIIHHGDTENTEKEIDGTWIPAFAGMTTYGSPGLLDRSYTQSTL